MADYPSLPIFTDAYLRDCWHLTDAEHGRYFLILMLLWQSPDCRIPNEPEWIARKLRRSLEAYEIEIAPLLKEFCQSSGNWITQKRLLREYTFVKKTSKKQSDTAKSRWNNDKGSSQMQFRHMPKRDLAYAPTPTPTPTPIEGFSEAQIAPSPPANPGKAQQGSRIAENWQPQPDDIAYGSEIGLTSKQIGYEFEKFMDYWRAQPGGKGVKLDWDGTWRNWLRRAADDIANKNQQHYGVNGRGGRH